MTLELAPQVRELLSDEQIASVQIQVESGEAPCLRCGERIDPELEAASVALIVAPRGGACWSGCPEARRWRCSRS